MNYLTVAQRCVTPILLIAFAASSLFALDDKEQVLAEFQKNKANVSHVQVLEDEPLFVAVTGEPTRKAPANWERGELLGVFAHRGQEMAPISIQPNKEFPTVIWIERQNDDSITFGLADPQYGALSDNLKLFFDPKTYFPRRIVQFPPVRVRGIRLVNGVLTITGNNGAEDFSAVQRNGAWHVTVTPGAKPVVPRTLGERSLSVPSMPVSTIGEVEQLRPLKVKLVAEGTPVEVDEHIGPFQRIGNKIWVGKTFYDAEGLVGIGDIGYYDDSSHNWTFLHIPQMVNWSTSALLVDGDTIWAGLVDHREAYNEPGGLLRYSLTSRQATIIPLPDVIDKIFRSQDRTYCGTSRGFAIVDGDKAHQFEFDPQMDGSYSVIPVP